MTKLEIPTTYSYEAHPLAALMPMMDDDAFAQHKADVPSMASVSRSRFTKE